MWLQAKQKIWAAPRAAQRKAGEREGRLSLNKLQIDEKRSTSFWNLGGQVHRLVGPIYYSSWPSVGVLIGRTSTRTAGFLFPPPPSNIKKAGTDAHPSSSFVCRHGKKDDAKSRHPSTLQGRGHAIFLAAQTLQRVCGGFETSDGRLVVR